MVGIGTGDIGSMCRYRGHRGYKGCRVCVGMGRVEDVGGRVQVVGVCIWGIAGRCRYRSYFRLM